MAFKNILDVKDISYQIGGKKINKNISFILEPSDFLSIIGPNGSGKSTLIKLITSEILPTSGLIKFLGSQLKDWHLNSLAKRRSVLSQSSIVSFPFTVLDIIKMGRFPYNQEGSLTNKEKKYCYDLIDIFDLTDFINASYMTLSGGEKQRVQLARTFIQIWNDNNYDQHLIVLDEPTNSLDIKHQLSLFDLLISLNKKGLTIINVLHDLNHALYYSTKTLMMRKGELIHKGLTNEILNNKNLENTFDVCLKVVPIDDKHKTIVLNRS